LKVIRLVKIIAVALSASLFLFGCSSEERRISVVKSTDSQITEQQKDSPETEESNGDSNAEPSDTEDVIELTKDNIHINQIGYRTADKKQVIVSGKASGFAVINGINGVQVFAGELMNGGLDSDSGDELYYGDFTEVRTAGTYYIVVPGIGQTDSFVIGDKVYNELKAGLLKSFYYQRCGMDLEEKFAGVWAHPACHTGKGKIYGDEKIEIDGNGGWHDAGDYGKYVVPGSVAAADLMMTWEFFPESCGDNINIPESGNGVPDILDEARVELEWLLKMQDQNTGGVYHKLTSGSFPPLAMMPQDDLSELLFSPFSAAATGDFAAVTAMASRIYKDFDGKFARACLKASEHAWNWLQNNVSSAGFTNPRDITTGEYGDDSDLDERIWAAAELYRATGDAVYNEYIKSNYQKLSGLSEVPLSDLVSCTAGLAECPKKCSPNNCVSLK
jgi:endoglucanase